MRITIWDALIRVIFEKWFDPFHDLFQDFFCGDKVQIKCIFGRNHSYLLEKEIYCQKTNKTMVSSHFMLSQNHDFQTTISKGWPFSSKWGTITRLSGFFLWPFGWCNACGFEVTPGYSDRNKWISACVCELRKDIDGRRMSHFKK
jgi:hypothetical protein